MGLIKQQSIRSSILIYIGFAFGAVNMLILGPKILGPELLGLTRIITDAGITLATLSTFGTIPVIYKFFPFYNDYLSSKKSDLPAITGFICLSGFILVCIIGYFSQDIIVRKYSEKSPLFVEYSYLVYPFSFFMLAFMWLESFGWSFRLSVLTNGLREILPRIFFTILTLLLSVSFLSEQQYLLFFSFSYLLSGVLLYRFLRKSGKFAFIFKLSNVTRRLKSRMVNFGLFIFGAHFLNLLARTIDTFILASVSKGGLADAAIFTIATYVVTLMEVPQRSLNSVTIPILADAWKNRDLPKISSIYNKSVSNLLVIGLAMLILFVLNSGNLEQFLGDKFYGVSFAILIIGIGKLIDLGTGANTQILGTSSYWKVDFTTTAIYTLLALPLNYVLISKYGIKGAAYSSLISICFYNLMRFGFLYYKFKLQPYTLKNLLVVVIAFVCGLCAYLLPFMLNIYIDSIIRSVLFILLFIPVIYRFNISEEINTSITSMLKSVKK
ncbi:oligosaccharide flippase family protein [Flavihumibacter sp. RY-1]|uniref:Oligosaccharide flippase family protein n=1 Tax=Flavihumibacter fluminis TaxID=2909236 RepID=A0ABS9BDR1_9BACT|nr:oligosaccharide flippase family protein [Flavihumibacter fluminis]MCF1713212.1 oligosaccharide flippase family protein [Flavihumibacter fluminis]